MAYATRADLHAHGLPRGVLVEQARAVAAVDTSTDRLTLEAHGLELDDAVQLVAGEGGTLPAPLSASTVYYARPVSGSESLLELAATAGGPAINITSAGVAPFSLVVSLAPAITAALDYYSRYVDRHLPAHAVPLEEPYPAEVVAIVAKLAAADLLRRQGHSIPAIEEGARIARGELLTFVKGIPLRDAAATRRTNAARSFTISPTVGRWTPEDGSIP